MWKDIKYYEGLYQVSDEGQIMSLNYKNTGISKILKDWKDSSGYLQVKLCKDGNEKIFLVHRLVAEAFIPNPDKLPEINHKSENKQDNRVENLEWCDRKHNVNYGSRNNIVSEKLTNGNLSKPVLQYSLKGTLIREYPSVMEIKRQFMYSQGNISSCCLGKRKTAYGYIWKYKE